MTARAPVARVPALDLARGLAVAFMIAVHVLEEWGSAATRAGPVGSVIEFFGSAPAAPVFVFLMGASLAWSRRAAPLAALRRGAGLLALGLTLNVVRGALPALIGLRLGLVSPTELGPYTPWNLTWIVDILVFAGPALALLAVVRASLRPWAMLLLAVAAAAPHLWGLTAGLGPVDAVLRSLWGAGDLVSFPLFPWLAYGLVGLAWGHWLRGSEEAFFFRRTALSGLVLLGAGTPALLAALRSGAGPLPQG
ncbi:MAG: heparan-alpha-glucosaminide N-acetyltransferase domain-containing protein [Pseudomonadota bacterium]